MHSPRPLLLLSVAFVAFHSTNAEAEVSILSITHLRPNGAQTTDDLHAVKDEKEVSDFPATKEERMLLTFLQYLGLIPRFEYIEILGFIIVIVKVPVDEYARFRSYSFMQERAANGDNYYM